MKTMRKVFALLMALSMILALAITANADGANTITISNAARGETYYLFKVVGATINDKGGIDYQGDIPEALKSVLAYTTVNVDGVSYNALGKNAGVTDDALFTALKNWAVGTGETPDYTRAVTSKTADGDTVNFAVDPGYYVIASTKGTTIMVDSATNPAAQVIEKNTSTPFTDISKTMTDGTAESVAINDVVPFELAFNTTNYEYDTDEEGNPKPETAKLVEQYTVVDTLPAGLTANSDVKVYVNSTKSTEGATEVALANTASLFTSDGLVIPWARDGASIYPEGSYVIITYTATVNGNANGAMTNTFTVNSGKTDGTDDTTVTTYKLTINKTDGTNALAGAKFKLYAADGTTEIALVKVSDGNYRLATTAEKEADGFESAVIEAGTAVINGLDGDLSYQLEETEAPAGYNKLTEKVEVKMYSEEGEGTEITKTPGDQTQEVVNNQGAELPSTGGIGTTIFTVVGATLMIGAAVLFITKKRSVN